MNETGKQDRLLPTHSASIQLLARLLLLGLAWNGGYSANAEEKSARGWSEMPPLKWIKPVDPSGKEGTWLFSQSAIDSERHRSWSKIFSPASPRLGYTSYPWKTSIVTTVFWVGEKPSPGNPVSNFASSWDTNWNRSFGGYDDPSPASRVDFRPQGFTPKQNPFYIALPYNDTLGNHTKDSARELVPWFKESFYREGRSVLKGRWVAIRRAGQICYAQWEDCGPFETDDWGYVFGDHRPRTQGNGGAGLDVSPAVRDFLGFRYSARCDWRFVDLHEVSDGPWKRWGKNNPFALRNPDSGTRSVSESLTQLYELRDQFLASNRDPSEKLPAPGSQ